MPEVTLQDILTAREARAARQDSLRKEFQSPLISFSMNIPGPIKDSPLIRRGFRAGLQELRGALAAGKFKSLHEETTAEKTGPEAFFCIQGEAGAVKKLCVQIEEAFPMGRLFDLDVEDEHGRKLSREDEGPPRSCLVCGKPGRGCASRRLHTVEELQDAVRNLLTAHFLTADQKMIAQLASKSLLDEVCTTPKPGLVDCANSGSHRDMDRFTFMASAAALFPYWEECVRIGRETAQDAPSATFRKLRQAGQSAERRMFAATKGINTHKGAIFTLGILCGAMGRLWAPALPASVEDILRECAELSASAVRDDFRKLSDKEKSPCTAGEHLYIEQGVKGIRGELAAGLPSLRETALPVLTDLLQKEQSRNEAGTITLLHLIARGEDTNLIARGGKEKANEAVQKVRELLQKHPAPSMEEITELDSYFIRENLSPGGCADLLAAAYFLHDWGEAVKTK